MMIEEAPLGLVGIAGSKLVVACSFALGEAHIQTWRATSGWHYYNYDDMIRQFFFDEPALLSRPGRLTRGDKVKHVTWAMKPKAQIIKNETQTD